LSSNAGASGWPPTPLAAEAGAISGSAPFSCVPLPWTAPLPFGVRLRRGRI